MGFLGRTKEHSFMRHIRLLAVLTAVLALLAVGAGIATAHNFRADSRVTITYNDAKDRFQGRVSSERPSCERNRLVVVFRDNPNQDSPVGGDRTNDNGFWAVPENNPHGEFYAKVFRRKVTRQGHIHVCRADRSPTITVEATPGPGRPF
jgi:hypothetical protein